MRLQNGLGTRGWGEDLIAVKPEEAEIKITTKAKGRSAKRIADHLIRRSLS